MTLSTSPALARVETALKLSSGSFAKNNYRSVFDIARTSRKQFVADNMSWLGLRGGRAWDLAMGQAQHIRRLFRQNRLTQQIRQGLPQTLSGQQAVKSTVGDNIQGLVQNGPTWQSQFAENWQAYCQSGAPEAVDSPVSYLTWLYKQALSFEQEIQASSTADQVITLAERRPDLATLTVDNDAVNQQIPALELVNEILEESIATVLPADQSVDETLAQTRYPTLLPYHFPHDQVELSLQNAGVALEDIIGQTATDWPWFLSDTLTGGRSNNSTELASLLAPEQQTLVTEADNSAASDMTNFYKANLGLATADYTPFENLDTFTRQLGITVPQVEELVAGGLETNNVTASNNCAVDSVSSSDYGAKFINNSAPYVFQDTGSHPVPLKLSESGLSTVDGKFDDALRCDALQQAEMYIDENFGSDGSELKNFTLAFWVKLPADVPDSAIIVTNKTDSWARKSKGITLFARRDDDAYKIELTVSDGTKDPLSYSCNINPDVWIFIAIFYSGNDILYIRGSYDNATMNIMNSIDFSSLGSIALSEECWGFNGNKGNDYYSGNSQCCSAIDFDDITVWDSSLSDEVVETFITSGKPHGGQSGMIHYYALDVTSEPITIENPGASNKETIPVDMGSDPNLLMCSENGLSVIEGRFGSALRCNALQQAEMYIDENIATTGSDRKTFTLTFWCRVPSDVQDQAIVVTNKTDHRALGSKGITLIALHEGNDYKLQLSISDGENDPLSQSISIDPDMWIFIAIRNNANETLYIRASTDNATLNIMNSINFSSLGSTVLSEECWGFNSNKGNSYYNSYPLRRSVIDFDDIAVWDSALDDGTLEDFVTSNEPCGGRTDMTHYYPLDGSVINFSLSNLSDDRMDRINRMVRLQRWLGLSYEETDLLLSACINAQGADNTDFSLNAHTLRALGVFRHWQQKYGVTAFEFAAVLDEITPYAISPAVPFFDQVFNSPSLFDEPFAITGERVSYSEVTGDSARRVRQLCAGLGITQAQFRVLADKVAAEQGDAQAKTFPLTLAVVSALYRLVMVPRRLGLSFAEGAALLSLAGEGGRAWTLLAGVPQLAALTDGQPAGGDILDLLMALDAAAEWATEHKLSWVKSYLALQPDSDALVATSATVNFVNGIKQQLPAALLSGQSFTSVPLPAGATVSSWLEVFPDLIDSDGLVLAAATDDDTITGMVSADITRAGITFASDAEREQAISTLSGIINQARLAQNGIADSALAQMFSTAQSLPPFLLKWAGDSEYRLLSDSLTMNNGAALTDPSQVPATYLTDLFALGQRAGISTAFTLTPATLSALLAHPEWFGVSDTTLTLTLLYRLSRYGDWLKVAGEEDRVLAYLSRVNGTTPPDAGQAAEALALLLAWESSEVADATASLSGGLAKTVADVDYVMRLQALSAETGLSVTPLLATGELVPGGVTETWDAWQSAGESLVAAQAGQQ